MKTKISILLFVLAAAFVYVGQMLSPVQALDAAPGLRPTPDALVAAGRVILSRQSTACLACHSIGDDRTARCPDLNGLGARAATRRPGYTAARYIVESLYNPNASVVPDYPGAQMPPADRLPVALSHDEVRAVICYVNSLGGTTDGHFIDELDAAQEPYRKGLIAIEPVRAAENRLAILPGEAARGRQLFQQKAACAKCHRAQGSGPETCPDLTAIGLIQGPEYILESIVAPNAVVAKGYKQSRVKVRLETGGSVSDVDLVAVVTAWMPSEAAPQRVRVKEIKQDETIEREFPVEAIAEIGDLIVVTKDPKGNVEATLGYRVEGDEKRGVLLKVMKSGRWELRRFPSELIFRLNPTLSPMPSNFADQLTVQEMFDLVTYLASARGSTTRTWRRD